MAPSSFEQVHENVVLLPRMRQRWGPHNILSNAVIRFWFSREIQKQSCQVKHGQHINVLRPTRLPLLAYFSSSGSVHYCMHFWQLLSWDVDHFRGTNGESVTMDTHTTWRSAPYLHTARSTIWNTFSGPACLWTILATWVILLNKVDLLFKCCMPGSNVTAKHKGKVFIFKLWWGLWSLQSSHLGPCIVMAVCLVSGASCQLQTASRYIS